MSFVFSIRRRIFQVRLAVSHFFAHERREEGILRARASSAAAGGFGDERFGQGGNLRL
jgi:hypothetical protein